MAGEPVAIHGGVAFRVFVSNPLFPSGTGNAPVLNIVNATTDLLVPAVVGLSGTISNPGLMAITPDKTKTLVFSSAENRIAVISNASEASAGSISLPGATKSMATAPDNITAYVAVPTAAIAARPPGPWKCWMYPAEGSSPPFRFRTLRP